MLNTKVDRTKLTKYSPINGSQMRVNREYLLRTGVAKDLNTYLGFNNFWAYGDIITNEQNKKYVKDPKAEVKFGAPGAKSIFNKFGSVLTGNDITASNLNAGEFRISNNVPLIDTPENRQKMRAYSNCTIKDLVEASSTGMLGRETYSYSDFMYCKHLGTMPNNYLITLRRFTMPVDDYISSTGVTSETRKLPDITSQDSLSIGEMVTWLNTPGNDLEQILTYSTEMPFEEKQSQWESSGISADNSTKPLNAIASVFDDKYRSQVSSGYAGTAVFQNDYVAKIFHTNGMDPPYSNLFGWQDSNKVYGPIYAVKKTFYPSDKGLNFNQSFKLTFEYEIRSYNGINGRQAMLDLISNILQVTYSTGTFWGGGYRGSGAHQNNIFANLKIMNVKGGFNDFVDAFFQDASNLIDSNFKNEQFSWKNLGKSVLNFFNNIGGMLVGGALNKMGRPQKANVNALLSPAPIGLWHVTIGNPFHPILSVGNMILKSTTITHTGPLGIDDFPTGLKVECELERGKPRDISGIEMMYMNGNNRIYFSMEEEIEKMYDVAKSYKKGSSNNTKKVAGLSAETAAYQYESEWNEMKNTAKTSLTSMKDTFMHYFGIDEKDLIITAAKEAGHGSQKKKADEQLTKIKKK